MTLGAGQAPVLDYNLPQSTCISALGRIELDIPTSWFLDSAAVEPLDHWWKKPLGDLDEIREGLAGDVGSSLAGKIVDRKVADVVRSGEERIAALAAADALHSAAPAAGSGTALRTTASAGIGAGRRVSVPAPPRPAPVSRTSSARTVNSRAWTVGLEETAQRIAEGYRPIALDTLGGAKTLEFIPKPRFPVPRIYLVEEYRVCSYLADYGAGKTVSTISLLPGEKRTLTLRTYRDSETTRTASENILDSFSQESADEFEELVESESGVSTGTSSSKTTTTSGETGLSVGVDLLGLVEVGVGGEIESTGTKEASTTQETYVDTLERALTKHVEKSSYTREVEVNTTTSETVSAGEEQSLVRELSNINHSRVLNFVVRQLLQEYVTVTYLHSVRVVYTNGYPETIVPMELYSLDEVLPRFVAPDRIEDVKAKILKPYCAVYNHRQQPKRFIERVERTAEKCEFAPEGERKVFYRKDPRLSDAVEGIRVPGVIKRVQRNVLRTPTVIIDALLGQGEALDCYNQTLQAAAAERSELSNAVTRQALDIVGSFATPEEKARAHVALLRECGCQSAGEDDEADTGGGTGGTGEDTP
jgi:hypothetical protein